MSPARLDAAVSKLEAALFDHTVLPDALDAAGRALGLDHLCLVHARIEDANYIASERTLEVLIDYAAGGWITVDYRAAHVNGTPTGQIFFDHLVVNDDDRRASAIYNELYIPHDMAYFAGWRFSVSGSTWIYSAARAEDKGPVVGDDARLLKQFMPFANRAALLAHQMREVRVQGMVDGLAGAGLAVLVLDHEGRVSLVTPQAEKLFDTDFGVRRRALRARDPSSNAGLALLASRARENGPLGILDNLLVRRMSGRTPVLVQPMPVRGLGVDAFPGARLLLVLERLDHSASINRAELVRLFELTPAEALVAEAIAAGLDLDDIAKSRAVSRETVRSQLKSIYRKMGVDQRSGVVRLLERISRMRRDE